MVWMADTCSHERASHRLGPHVRSPLENENVFRQRKSFVLNPAYKCFRCSPASSIQSSQHRSICNNHLNNHLHPQALCALLCWRNNTLILLLQFCRFFFVSALTTCCIGQLLKLAVARQPLVSHILLSWCDHGRTKYSRGRFDFMCVHVLVFGSWGVWWERMLCVCVCVGNCYVLKFWVLVDPMCCWEALYGTIVAEGTARPYWPLTVFLGLSPPAIWIISLLPPYCSSFL